MGLHVKIRTEETYEFYYQREPYGVKVVFSTKRCKCPRRTNDYKSLLEAFNQNTYHCIGWKTL